MIRGDKKLLNSINARTGAGALQYFLPDTSDPSKRKPRISSDAEKIYLLIGDALSDTPATDIMDFAMRHECDHIVRVSQRIALCMARYFAHVRRLAATANAFQLVKALKQRMWEGTTQQCRQLPNVGRLIASRLASHALGSLKALSEADARRIELVTDRNYPFGTKLKQEVKLKLPPHITVEKVFVCQILVCQISVFQILSVLLLSPGGRMEFQVIVTRSPPNSIKIKDQLHQLHSTEETATNKTQGDALKMKQKQLRLVGGDINSRKVTVGGCGVFGGDGGSREQQRKVMGVMDQQSSDAAGSEAAVVGVLYSSHTPGRLLVGSCHDDKLLLMKQMVMETFPSPYKINVIVDPPEDKVKGDFHLVASVVLDNLVGLDEVASSRAPASSSTALNFHNFRFAGSHRADEKDVQMVIPQILLKPGMANEAPDSEKDGSIRGLQDDAKTLACHEGRGDCSNKGPFGGMYNQLPLASQAILDRMAARYQLAASNKIIGLPSSMSQQVHTSNSLPSSRSQQVHKSSAINAADPPTGVSPNANVAISKASHDVSLIDEPAAMNGNRGQHADSGTLSHENFQQSNDKTLANEVQIVHEESETSGSELGDLPCFDLLGWGDSSRSLQSCRQSREEGVKNLGILCDKMTTNPFSTAIPHSSIVISTCADEQFIPCSTTKQATPVNMIMKPISVTSASHEDVTYVSTEQLKQQHLKCNHNTADHAHILPSSSRQTVAAAIRGSEVPNFHLEQRFKLQDVTTTSSCMDVDSMDYIDNLGDDKHCVPEDRLVTGGQPLQNEQGRSCQVVNNGGKNEYPHDYIPHHPQQRKQAESQHGVQQQQQQQQMDQKALPNKYSSRPTSSLALTAENTDSLPPDDAVQHAHTQHIGSRRNQGGDNGGHFIELGSPNRAGQRSLPKTSESYTTSDAMRLGSAMKRLKPHISTPKPSRQPSSAPSFMEINQHNMPEVQRHDDYDPFAPYQHYRRELGYVLNGSTGDQDMSGDENTFSTLNRSSECNSHSAGYQSAYNQYHEPHINSKSTTSGWTTGFMSSLLDREAAVQSTTHLFSPHNFQNLDALAGTAASSKVEASHKSSSLWSKPRLLRPPHVKSMPSSGPIDVIEHSSTMKKASPASVVHLGRVGEMIQSQSMSLQVPKAYDLKRPHTIMQLAQHNNQHALDNKIGGLHEKHVSYNNDARVNLVLSSPEGPFCAAAGDDVHHAASRMKSAPSSTAVSLYHDGGILGREPKYGGGDYQLHQQETETAVDVENDDRSLRNNSRKPVNSMMQVAVLPSAPAKDQQTLKTLGKGDEHNNDKLARDSSSKCVKVHDSVGYIALSERTPAGGGENCMAFSLGQSEVRLQQPGHHAAGDTVQSIFSGDNDVRDDRDCRDNTNRGGGSSTIQDCSELSAFSFFGLEHR
ncbi:hypothetical protein CEUSTIGMA_g12984.t1 [Chlamydomonas eustigma]|uniref:SEC63 domain-containing protein n=1 Tax=Chlamydomonas eustigma TaxID=1157962 RepID=A0A250XRJ6_9CHLO|nr:hypothetical protein CEUSTIGMA_g12984.t1 [Chlamydomonas eustigma]|eukprot:GAX85569.1 hypothetical protein CEUSTIGMA_g12984.t1 [Chlamydomonas eustigma]